MLFCGGSQAGFEVTTPTLSTRLTAPAHPQTSAPSSSSLSSSNFHSALMSGAAPRPLLGPLLRPPGAASTAQSLALPSDLLLLEAQRTSLTGNAAAVSHIRTTMV